MFVFDPEKKKYFFICPTAIFWPWPAVCTVYISTYLLNTHGDKWRNSFRRRPENYKASAVTRQHRKVETLIPNAFFAVLYPGTSLVIAKGTCIFLRPRPGLAQWSRRCATSRMVSLGIFSVVPPDKTMCPEVDSASENEYQRFLLG